MSSPELEGELTLKERLNFPYLLANQILTFQKAILNLEFSEREIKEAIEGLVHMIPENWKDKKFAQGLKAAKSKRKRDVRPLVTGNMRMSKDVCVRLGIPTEREEESLDYYKVFQACINLLDRKQMLSKIMRIEQLEGIQFDKITENDLRQSDIPSE